jgi:hypothetical protein
LVEADPEPPVPDEPPDPLELPDPDDPVEPPVLLHANMNTPRIAVSVRARRCLIARLAPSPV